MSNVEDRVRAIVAEHLDIDRDEIYRDSPFATDLGADSLDHANLMIEFEKAFEMRFPPGSAERVQSIGDVVTLIESSRAA